LKTVKKALDILDSFTREHPIQGITEIATKLGIHKSTAHSILNTLKEDGFIIYETESRKYRLGFKIIELGGRISYKQDLRELSIAFMQMLSKSCDEDIALNILVEGRRICICLVESRYFVRQFVPLGKALPAHCSAAGKALLAFLPPAELDSIIDKYGLPPFTKNTITDRNTLTRELETIRSRGYGESWEEYGKDAAALAFPILNGQNKAVAALSIQSTISRFKKADLNPLIKEGIQTAEKISQALPGVFISSEDRG